MRVRCQGEDTMIKLIMIEQTHASRVKWNGLGKDVLQVKAKIKNCPSCILTRPTPLSWFEVSKPSLKALHSPPYHTIFITSKRHSIVRFYLRSFFRRVSTSTQRPSPLSLLFLHLYFALPVQFIPTRPLSFDIYTHIHINTHSLTARPTETTLHHACSLKPPPKSFYLNLIDRTFVCYESYDFPRELLL